MFILIAINNYTAGSRSATSERWNYFKDLANMVCSRESTYRCALDVTAFDIPTVGADILSFRGVKKTIESVFECASGFFGVIISPIANAWVGKLMSNFTLDQNLRTDAVKYMRFHMNELEDNETFIKAIERIKKEGPEDKETVASLQNSQKMRGKYLREGKEIKDFCDKVKHNIENMSQEEIKELRDQIYKLKKYTIVGESMYEGGWWGSYGLVSRLFRKHVLGADRFTGTESYVSDAESETLGEANDLSALQIGVGIVSIFLSPAMNLLLLNAKENKETRQGSKLLQKVHEHFDMTHGVYPKLGLLFTITTIPKWLGTITLAQGWNERVERMLKAVTVIPSWWLGHRATNGILAKQADEQFAKHHGIGRGTLIEKEDLNSKFPEPAKINYIYEQTKENKEQWEDAEDKHARCLYKGFALHSVGVWVINMVVNFITRFRALKALDKEGTL